MAIHHQSGNIGDPVPMPEQLPIMMQASHTRLHTHHKSTPSDTPSHT